ncbi:MAG: hypothetical protein LBC02_01040 [Planctomycetaceae bacterium]|jgi:cytochrome c556|nr:hypothetical protein [Planctomycetaceae bacterium]
MDNNNPSCFICSICATMTAICFLCIASVECSTRVEVQEELRIIRQQLAEERKGRIDDLHQFLKQEKPKDTDN